MRRVRARKPRHCHLFPARLSEHIAVHICVCGRNEREKVTSVRAAQCNQRVQAHTHTEREREREREREKSFFLSVFVLLNSSIKVFFEMR